MLPFAKAFREQERARRSRAAKKGWKTRKQRHIEQFREFSRHLEAAKLEDDQVFQALMHDAQILLEMSDSEIANSLSISRPTLKRWINGRTTPHVAIRKSAAKWISEQVTARS